ncbi:hypothetical protein DFO77_1483 [Marinilabilia salmonicolor]|uniref:Uncharacterized protein n=1 Tax=Marinilabilia salmonicolor TaxID=989 RepID=A0A368UNU0_9BACT|nr:hypothetical protein DFO77_1483 [Marinilabilia salmonicolor]
MRIPYDSYSSLLLLNPSVSRRKFLNKVGVKKNTYSYDMFYRIYDFIHSELIDLRKEYEKYYSIEYDTYENFIYHKLNIEYDVIESVKHKLKENKSLRLFYKPDELSYGDSGSIYNFVFSEEMEERIFNLLR